MRILLVNDYAGPLGGAEAAQVVLRDALRRRGHDVRIFATNLRTPGGEPTSADYECFGTTSRFRTLLQSFNPWAAFSLRKAVREFRPDVVHVRVFLTQLSPLILPILRDVPTLHHATWNRTICPIGTKILPDGSPCREEAGWSCFRHGCVPRRDVLPLLIQMKLWRRWAGVFRIIVSNSGDVRRLLTAEGFPCTDEVWNGVRVVPARPPLAEAPTAFCAAQLVSQKGLDVLLHAFARVAREIPAARLWIAGDGPERAGLTALVRSLGIPSSSVRMLGFLSRPELEREAAEAWVQVIPSRWAESFANAAAEAMMRGTAVIASALGAMTEYIRDGESGILVPPGDERALADALVTVLRSRELAEKMGCRGRAIALCDLNDDICAQRFESLYRRLMEAHAGTWS